MWLGAGPTHPCTRSPIALHPQTATPRVPVPRVGFRALQQPLGTGWGEVLLLVGCLKDWGTPLLTSSHPTDPRRAPIGWGEESPQPPPDRDGAERREGSVMIGNGAAAAGECPLPIAVSCY